MRMHTAQHLVRIAYRCLMVSKTIGNQIHTEKSRIDFKPIQFTEECYSISRAVNEQIQQGLEVTDSQMTRDQINSLCQKIVLIWTYYHASMTFACNN